MIRHNFPIPDTNYFLKHINDEGIYLPLNFLGDVAFLMRIRKNYDNESFQFFKVEKTNLIIKEQSLIQLQPRSLEMFNNKDETTNFIEEIMQIFGMDKNLAFDIYDWALKIFNPYEPEYSEHNAQEQEKKVHEEILEDLAREELEREKQDLIDDMIDKAKEGYYQSQMENNEDEDKTDA